MLFGLGAILRHSHTPSLRVAGFEDSLSDEAYALCCQPLEVGLASEARSTTSRWRSRKDDDEDENEAPSRDCCEPTVLSTLLGHAAYRCSQRLYGGDRRPKLRNR